MSVSTDAMVVFGWEIKDWEDQRSRSKIHHEDELETHGEVECLFDLAECLHEDKSHDLMLVRHCHYAYPMWILGFESTYLRARRGYPETIAPMTPPDSCLISAARDIASRLDIPIGEEEPNWLLFSDSDH